MAKSADLVELNCIWSVEPPNTQQDIPTLELLIPGNDRLYHPHQLTSFWIKMHGVPE